MSEEINRYIKIGREVILEVYRRIREEQESLEGLQMTSENPEERVPALLVSKFKQHREKDTMNEKTEEMPELAYARELRYLVQTIRKEITLSGKTEHRDNVVMSMIDKFTRRYVLVNVQLSLEEIDVILSLLRSDGGPSNHVETNIVLKLAFSEDAYLQE